MWKMRRALGRYLSGRERGKLVRGKGLLEDLFNVGGTWGGYIHILSFKRLCYRCPGGYLEAFSSYFLIFKLGWY